MALARKNRLRSTGEIGPVIRRGRAVSNELALMRYTPRHDGGDSRFAFVVSRKAIKKSSTRNIVRRRSAEWVRKHLIFFGGGHDIVLVFKKASGELKRSVFYSLLADLFEKANLFR